MSEHKDDKDRPTHSIDPGKRGDAGHKSGAHEIDAPLERTDDEVGSEEEKVTKRQE